MTNECDMNTTTLTFEVCKQKLERTDSIDLVSDSVKLFNINIDFKTSQWQTCLTNEEVYVIFKTETGANYCMELDLVDTNIGACIIPGKVLMGDFFHLTVFGINDTVRLTTNELTVNLVRSGFTTDLESYDIENETGDIFSYLMELISNCLVDVRTQGNQLLFYKEDTVYYRFTIDNHTHLISQVTGLEDCLLGKQDTLVSGENIKTINNQSLLGSGNITIHGGGSVNMVGAFTINGDGDLIVELPDGYSNPYSINGDGDLIYDTSVTREET